MEDRWNAPNDGISVEEQEDDPNSLLNHYRVLLSLRKNTQALNSGAYSLLEMRGGKFLWGLMRYTENEQVICLFNFGEDEAEITLPDFPFSAEGLTDQVSLEKYPASIEGEPYSLILPPASGVILSP